jgi:hypothetical protein
MVGYAEAELLTKSFQEITHPDGLHDDELLQRIVAGEWSRYATDER